MVSTVTNRPTALRSRWKTALDLRVGIAVFAVLVIAINAVVLMGNARKEEHAVLQSAALDNVRVATAFE